MPVPIITRPNIAKDPCDLRNGEPHSWATSWCPFPFEPKAGAPCSILIIVM